MSTRWRGRAVLVGAALFGVALGVLVLYDRAWAGEHDVSWGADLVMALVFSVVAPLLWRQRKDRTREPDADHGDPRPSGRQRLWAFLDGMEDSGRTTVQVWRDKPMVAFVSGAAGMFLWSLISRLDAGHGSWWPLLWAPLLAGASLVVAALLLVPRADRRSS